MSTYPGLTADSDFIAKFLEMGGSDSSECFWYLSMGELSKIDESMFAELQSLSSGGCADIGLGNLSKSKSEIVD